METPWFHLVPGWFHNGYITGLNSHWKKGHEAIQLPIAVILSATH